MKVLIFWIGCLSAVLWGGVNAQPEPRQDDSVQEIAGAHHYHVGLDAARRGDDKQAQEAFESAISAGYDTPRLHYNLGVVRYRMGEYGKAARAFRRAAKDPELAALAEYNLGLLASRRDDWMQARDRFGRAERAARTAGLRGLVDRGLEGLPPAPRPHLALGEFSVGYDDAAGRSIDDQSRGHLHADLFAGLWLYGGYWLTGNAYRGVEIVGSMYSLFHFEESDADLLLLEAGVVGWHPIDHWETGTRVTARHNRLGGAQFENSAELAVEASRLLVADDVPSGPRLGLRFRLERIDGAPRYAYVSGMKYDARFRFGRSLFRGRFMADYTLELNDRTDLRTETQFASASPVRHRFGLSYRQPLSRYLDLSTLASWRVSQFRGRDTLVDETTRQRKDDRLAFSGTITYRGFDHTTPFIRGDWLSNTSNIDDYAYDQIRLSVGVTRTW